jgi:hypothetical protein
VESSITFDIGTTNSSAKLSAEVWLDNELKIAIDHVVETVPVTITVDDDDADHELQIVLKNKTVNDTVVDSAGNIVQDSCLIVNNFKFDGIDTNQLVSEQAVYRHSFNDSAPIMDDKFYWLMGCNGTVSLRFTTPIYIWLLEHM